MCLYRMVSLRIVSGISQHLAFVLCWRPCWQVGMCNTGVPAPQKCPPLQDTEGHALVMRQVSTNDLVLTHLWNTWPQSSSKSKIPLEQPCTNPCKSTRNSSCLLLSYIKHTRSRSCEQFFSIWWLEVVWHCIGRIKISEEPHVTDTQQVSGMNNSVSHLVFWVFCQQFVQIPRQVFQNVEG